MLNKDFLRLDDRSADDLHRIIGNAASLRRRPEAGGLDQGLSGRRFAAIWDGEGFRNRVAFELGVRLMGGHLVEVPERLGTREPLVDLGGYLDNWFDGLIVRTPSYERLEELASHMQAPVINARTGRNHPCEILGDLAFVVDLRGTLNHLHVMFVGAATNLLGSWLEAAVVLPIRLTQVCPKGYDYEAEWLRGSGARDIHVARDLDAVREADILYTDAWPLSHEGDAERIAEVFGQLRITAEVLNATPADCVFLPCPPVTRGQEVNASAMEHPKCSVPGAKEWLLHAQNALLLDIFAG